MFDDTTDLLFGRIDFITTLHAPALEQRLTQEGIVARVARGAAVPREFLQAERANAQVTVPAQVREQVQVGLMMLSTLLATIDWFLGEIARYGAPGAQVDLFYTAEDQVWEQQ